MSLIEITNGQDFQLQEREISGIDSELQELVGTIINEVIKRGDQALFDYTTQFDGVDLSALRVSKTEILAASQKIDPQTRNILTNAINNVRDFHQNQNQKSWEKRFDDGTRLGEIVRAVDRAGIYIPGGKAFYPSTMIMNTIPAQLADVPSIVVTSPPGQDGLPHPLVLGICSMLEIDEVYSVGGAQAVAAMAYGTDSIAPVCVITGPGNRFVAEAKRQVFGKVGIDSIAGPS
ncbi:MAG: histidinol dehydrogenase, partial [Proteobacteria bacterium]|nr:histidinol dehydrogenase [Pseudomonadota bacterium]